MTAFSAFLRNKMAEKIHEHVPSDEKSDSSPRLGVVEKIVPPPTIVPPPLRSNY